MLVVKSKVKMSDISYYAARVFLSSSRGIISAITELPLPYLISSSSCFGGQVCMHNGLYHHPPEAISGGALG